jgi:hypothetical protein
MVTLLMMVGVVALVVVLVIMLVTTALLLMLIFPERFQEARSKQFPLIFRGLGCRIKIE